MTRMPRFRTVTTTLQTPSRHEIMLWKKLPSSLCATRGVIARAEAWNTFGENFRSLNELLEAKERFYSSISGEQPTLDS